MLFQSESNPPPSKPASTGYICNISGLKIRFKLYRDGGGRVFKNIVRQGLLTQFVSLTINILAGIGLALMRGALEELPGMLIMIPAFLQMRGAIGGTLASRLSSALHMGIIEPRLKFSKELTR
ncbi:MAG: hypothetical protein QXS67_02625, partial [Candidatus Nezhaarchaeales archaeon]